MVFLLTILPLLAGAVTRDEEEFVTELRYVPEGWLAVGALAVVALICWAVVWMYRYEGRRGSSGRVRVMLAVLRCMVLLALAVIILEPIRVRILRRWIDSYTVVLLDSSSSMGLADLYRDESMAVRVAAVLDGSDGDSTSAGSGSPGAAGGSSTGAPILRTTLVQRVLNRDDRRFLRELAENNRVKLYTFSDKPELLGTIRATREKAGSSTPVGQADDPTPSPGSKRVKAGKSPSQRLFGVDDVATTVSAIGPATNIDRSTRRAVESLGSAPVAAVVLLSDGGFNQGASVEQTARYLRDRGIPLHAVGIGDPSKPLNVRVIEILAPPNAFQRDPFSISARLTAEGIDGRNVLVRLRERNATDGGVGRVVDTRSVRVGPGGAMEPVEFERKQNRVGRFVYVVEIPVLDGESVADDNSKQTTVNVIDSRTRVLLIAGGPSWEYRFVSRLFERDDTFDVSCWLQSADLSAVRDGNTIIDHLPVSAEELFDYDVVILMDPQKDEFDQEWGRLVDTLVTEYGGGLLFSAARSHSPAFLRDRMLKPLHDLLPVTLDPEADIVLNEVGYYQTSASHIDFPTTAFGHPIMQLAGDSASTRLAWQALGGVYWHFPVLREKPVATVLMRHSHPRMRNAYGGHVLAAVQFVGAGRTAFLAFDGTWRWRRQNVRSFDRFWVQLIRYLAEGKLLGGTKRGMLLTQGDEFALGEAVTVTARLLDRQYRPLRRDQVVAAFSVEADRGDFVLAARPDRPGYFEGRFVPDRTGSYRLSLKVPQPGAGDPMEITREIRVTRPNLEILRPQMDRAKLMALSQQSEGGRYFEVDEASELPALIPDLHEEISIRSRPTTLWDNWKVMAFLLTLLTVEWGVRKWNRML